MSFYGNVFYEFAQLFRHFMFKNSGYNNNTILTAKPKDTEAIAQERWDILTMDTGNRWIVLQGSEDGVTFSHAGPGAAEFKPQVKTIDNYSLDGSGTSGAPYVLNYDETFSMPTFTFQFDKAGHYVTRTVSNVHFKMPPAPDPEKLYEAGAPDLMAENTTAVGFNKVTSASGATELKAGDVFSTNTITLTDKGTVKNINTKYYKLPISETEKDLTTLTNAVNKLQDTVDDIPDKYATKQNINDLEGTLDDMISSQELTTALDSYVLETTHTELANEVNDLTQNLQNNYYTKNEITALHDDVDAAIKDIQETYAKTEDVGVIDDLYNKKTEVLDEDKFATITAAIGNLEASSKAVSSTEEVLSVAEQISQVSQELDIIGNTTWALQDIVMQIHKPAIEKISNLEARIQSLEEKLT